MAIIEVSTDSQNDLTIFMVHGELTADEVIQSVEALSARKPTKFVLWDATDGSVANVPTEEIQRVAQTMMRFLEKRKEGKTAFVVATDLDYGLGRMYEAFAENEGLPYAYGIFKTVKEAKQWLGIKA